MNFLRQPAAASICQALAVQSIIDSRVSDLSNFGPTFFVVFIAHLFAVAVFFLPEKRWFQVAFSFFGILNIFHFHPAINNHEILTAGLMAVIIFSPSNVLNFSFYGFVSVYLWSGFHKLNSSFWDLETTCVKFLSEKISNRALFGGVVTLGEEALRASVLATYFIELVCPILLLVRRFSYHILLVLVFFHGILSFQYIAFSYYALFFLVAGLIKKDEPIFGQLWQKVLVLVFFHYQILEIRPFMGVSITGWISFVGYIAFAFNLILKSENNLKPPQFKIRYDIIPLIFVSVFAIMPYLQLRTSLTFSMYSNLRTVVNPNHFLLNAIIFQSTDLKPVPTGVSSCKKLPLHINQAVSSGAYLPIYEEKKIQERYCVNALMSLGEHLRVYRGIDVEGENRCRW